MSTKKADIAELDQYYPPCGPCAFCGHRDKRHRLWDAVLDRVAAGDTPEYVAKDLEISVSHVAAVLRIRPYRRK